MENVRKHFEDEAREFDEIIPRLIPHYSETVDALVAALPFPQSDAIRVIDLGCGTGSIAQRVRQAFPNAALTCLDLADSMLQVSEERLGTKDPVRFIRADFASYYFDDVYDAAVSSLALHHLTTDEAKMGFYRKIFAALSPGGVFFNSDVILGATAELQDQYMEKWKAFIGQSYSAEEIENKWLAKYRDEDHPVSLMSQLRWLTEIGFVGVDVVWKYYNFAVYGGRKPLTAR